MLYSLLTAGIVLIGTNIYYGITYHKKKKEMERFLDDLKSWEKYY